MNNAAALAHEAERLFLNLIRSDDRDDNLLAMLSATEPFTDEREKCMVLFVAARHIAGTLRTLAEAAGADTVLKGIAEEDLFRLATEIDDE